MAPNVFDKTFSVFNPYPDKRKSLGSFVSAVVLSPLLVFAAVMFFAYTALLKLVEMGFLLSLCIAIVCLGLMMVAEASETRTNANSLMNAVRSGDDLAKGDLIVLSLVKDLLPKLSAYYLCLGTMLLASSMTLSHLISGFLFVFSQFIGALLETAIFAGILAPTFAAFLFAIAVFMVFAVARAIRSKVFGLYPSGRLASAWSASARSRITSEQLAHILDSKPDEATW